MPRHARITAVSVFSILGFATVAFVRPLSAAGPLAAPPIQASRLAIQEDAQGQAILAVHYPWKVHQRPSVEVRMLGPEETDSIHIQPLYFLHDFMRGRITIGVYQCQDKASQMETTVPMTARKIEFEALGDRNLLGRPSVCVACRTDTVPPGNYRAARAVFPLLDPWATNERTLLLTLPKAYFGEKGRLRVWFLRREDIVWSETIPWPGTSKQAATKK